MKTLKITDESKCTGCKLCSLACSRKAEKQVAVESSFVRVIKSGEKGYKVSVDVGKMTPEIATYVAPFCPKNLLEVTDA